MTETEHLHLKKMGQGDYYNVDDMNRNSDLIDAKLKTLESDLEVTNTELANKANISALGKPNGIATLNGNGKLAQMPTAAEVGAEPKLIVTDYSRQVVETNGFKSYLLVKKMGHLVVVKNYIDKGSGAYSVKDGAKVAILPAAVAPSSTLYFACTAYNFDGGEYAAHVLISANGAVTTHAPASATIAVIDAVYLV